MHHLSEAAHIPRVVLALGNIMKLFISLYQRFPNWCPKWFMKRRNDQKKKVQILYNARNLYKYLFKLIPNGKRGSSANYYNLRGSKICQIFGTTVIYEHYDNRFTLNLFLLPTLKWARRNFYGNF